MAAIDELKKVRLEKLKKLRQAEINPYPAEVDRKDVISKARKKDGENVAVAGRIMSLRGHGKIIFCDLLDATGKIQIVFKKDLIGEKEFKLLDLLDIGDFLWVLGKVEKTSAGEISVFSQNLKILTKTLRPLPDKWHGFKDIEERYRQRYVDLIINPQVREIFETRSKVISFLRNYLDKDGFLEVETPVLQPVYGGASAKPFVTHHNTLDLDMYLRISDELYLKRLIVGGIEKVYELSKDFRNEGIDHQHNPEFTMLEFYWAYADYHNLMSYSEKMLSSLVKDIKDSFKLTYEDKQYDFTPPWPRISYREIVLKYTGIDIDIADDDQKLIKEINRKKLNFNLSGLIGFGAILDELYKKFVRHNLSGPLFLVDRPTAFVTLAKRLPDDPRKTASFQLIVAGKELINAYNELNDPVDQAMRFTESEKLAGKGQLVHEAYDEDYIRALEYGMPPTAGWGLGIDRLISVLTDKHNIKDVILFPTLKPEFPLSEKENKRKK